VLVLAVVSHELNQEDVSLLKHFEV
jgi:hypothetical protein